MHEQYPLLFISVEKKKKKKENAKLSNAQLQTRIQMHNYCVFGKNYFCQLILLFNLFFILFMSLITLFDTIYESRCTILANFYFYL